MMSFKTNLTKSKSLYILVSLITILTLGFTTSVYATTPTPVPVAPATSSSCDGINTAFNFGCSNSSNPIMSLVFAIIKFLSDGIGLIIIASTVYAGVQYVFSQGDPQKTTNAKTRIRSNVIAIFIYIFIYAILNYLIPNTLFK